MHIRQCILLFSSARDGQTERAMIAPDLRDSARRGLFLRADAGDDSHADAPHSQTLESYSVLLLVAGFPFLPSDKEKLMKPVRMMKLGVLALALAGVGLLTETTWAQKTKGKTRAATTKQLMKGLVVVNCGGVSNDLKEKEVNWDNVTQKAALLNEAGYILMDDGRCPDKDWAQAAKAIQESSKLLLAAAEKKDLEGAQAAFKTLTTEGCAVCHKAHRPK